VNTDLLCERSLVIDLNHGTAGILRTQGFVKQINIDIPKFHCFTVHFNSLNFTHQLMHFYIYYIYIIYTGCPRRNGQNFGRVFLMINYTDITQNTYIQSWTVTEIMAIEKCGLLGFPRTVSRPWRHTHPLRIPGNEKPLANIGMQWPWRDNAQLWPV